MAKTAKTNLRSSQVLSKPPRTEADAKAQMAYVIHRDMKLMERLAKR